MPVASLLTSLEDFEGAPAFVSYGGGSGASVGNDVVIQGTQSAGRRVDNTTNKGFGVPVNADLSAAGQHVKVWLFVTQWGEVTQVQIRISSGADDDHELPAAEYPPLGGFIPVWVDVSRIPEVGGSANEAAISEIGVMLDIGDVGGNAPNLIQDEILHGTSGLRWTDAGGEIADFRAFETTNREGNLVTLNGIDFGFSRLEIGDGATATDFELRDGTLAFPDQSLVADNFMGITVRAGADFTGRDFTIQSANIAGATKRPDFVLEGTTETRDLREGFNLLGLRLIDLNASADATGGTWDTIQLTQAGATIDGVNIGTRAAVGVACLTDPDFGLLSNIVWTQTGDGHAYQIDTVGAYDLTGFKHLNYGPNGADDAAINVTATTGTVTLNVAAGGDTPTNKSAGALVVINNPIAATFEVSFSDAGPADYEWRLYEADPNPGILGTVEIAGNETETVLTVVHQYNYTTDQDAVFQVIAPGYIEPEPIELTLGNTNQTQTIRLVVDENI